VPKATEPLDASLAPQEFNALPSSRNTHETGENQTTSRDGHLSLWCTWLTSGRVRRPASEPSIHPFAFEKYVAVPGIPTSNRSSTLPGRRDLASRQVPFAFDNGVLQREATPHPLAALLFASVDALTDAEIKQGIDQVPPL
jgi:hypothetical protein